MVGLQDVYEMTMIFHHLAIFEMSLLHYPKQNH